MKKIIYLALVFVFLSFGFVSAWGTTCMNTQPTLEWNAVYNNVSQQLVISYRSTYCLQADEIYDYLNCGDKLDYAMSGINSNFCYTLSNGAGGTGNHIWLYDCVGNTSKCCGGADDFDECVSNVDSKWDGAWQEKCYGHGVGINACTGGAIPDKDAPINFERTIISPFSYPSVLPECSGPGYIGTGYKTGWMTKSIDASELNSDLMISSYSFYHGDDTHCERTRVTQLGISDLPDCSYDNYTGVFSGDCCKDNKISGLNCESQCEIDSDCGNISVESVCDINDSVTTTITPKCEDGKCGIDTDVKRVACDYGCSDGECNPSPGECDSDSDCEVTICLEAGSYCSGLSIFHNYLEPVCINPGEVDSHCSTVIDTRVIAQCLFECSNGACVI